MNPLLNFVKTLLYPHTEEALLSVLPGAVERLLSGRVECRVETEPVDVHEIGLQPNGKLLVIPLDDGKEPSGVLRIMWNETGPLPDHEAELASQAAEFASIALVRCRAADAAREDARAEAADLKFDLIGMLAHEMRTPLASIKGYASALLLDELELDTETARDFIKAIEEESDQMTEMVAHLLDSTVIEAGALELHRGRASIGPIVRQVVEKMSLRTDRHKIVNAIGDEFPAVYVDEARIQQVVVNLIDNAIKYSPDGGLILIDGSVARNEVRVRVSDQGVGIAPEHLNKLFERFFRTEQRRIVGVSGTGLGLPIADAIVRAHGGRIWAESVVDQGTTITFTVPIATDGQLPADRGESVE